jgi:hypothetical protein
LFGAELLFLAVADDADAVTGYAGCDECGLGGVGAVFTEGDVVLGRTTVVAVAADEDLDGGMGVEVGGSSGDGAGGLRVEVVAVVGEEDVLHVGLELGVRACGATVIGWGSGDLGDADGDADVGFGGAAVVLGYEVEVGGAGGRDGLGAVDRDFADAVDADAGGVGGAPVEDDGLAKINGHGVGSDGGGRRSNGFGSGCSGGGRGSLLFVAACGGQQSKSCNECGLIQERRAMS